MSFNQYQLEQYAVSLIRNKDCKCTTCKHSRATVLTYDPDMRSIAYLCKDCYKAYCVQLEERERVIKQ